MIRSFLFSALAVLALTGAIACGDDDDDSNDGSDDPTSVATSTEDGDDDASPSPAGGNASPSPSGGDDDDDGTATATSGSGGGNQDDVDEFTDLVEGNEDKTYTIVYDVTFEVDGETSTGQWTLAQDPPRNAAIIEADGQKIWAIDDGTDQYSCFETGEDEGQCLKSPGGLGDELVDPDDLVDEAEESPNLKEIDGRTIAGRDARCFEFTGDLPEDNGVVCVDEDEGYMLLVEAEGTTMEATDVSSDAPDELFEPPFDVLG
jgi:hypothetical protein